MRVIMILLLGGLAACSQSGTQESGAASAPPGSASAASVPAASAPAASAPAATQPTQPGPAAGAPTASLHGTVKERIDASSYSYLRLTTELGETWAAVPATTVEVGTEVTVLHAMPMHGFTSQALGRTFEKLFFGTLEGAPPVAGYSPGGTAAAGGAGTAAPAPAPAVAAGAAAPHGGDPSADKGAALASFIKSAPLPVKTERAAGPDGRTIAEVYAQKAALQGKTVVIRGQVVKYNEGILGRNWVHLRDGSGTEAAGDHDITVTTQDRAAIGDVVVVNGTLQLDRDFGAGYAYPVIVETATVEKGEI